MRKLIITLSHSSLFVPEDLRKRVFSQEEMILHSDIETDKIYHFPNAKIFPATISRFVVDLNRRRHDRGEKGVLIKNSWNGQKVWSRFPSEKEKEKLLQRYWDTYYQRISQAVQKEVEQKNQVLLVDGHSMNPFGGKNSIDPRNPRPDIDLCTNHLTTCQKEIVFKIRDVLEKLKYWVEIDKPYSGRKAGIINRFSVPGKVDCLAIEVNKKLYMKSPQDRGSVSEEKIRQLNRDLFQAVSPCLK